MELAALLAAAPFPWHTKLFRKAVSVFGGKLQHQPIWLLLDGGDDQLNDVTGFVFQFYWKILGAQDCDGCVESVE